MNPEELKDELELSSIFQELSRPAQPRDMPKRIDLCRRALELISPDNRELWAALHDELANSLAQSPQNDRGENIEQAIEHYRQALKVYTKKALPEDWAMTQNNLALAYIIRIRGDRAENIEQAIEHCRLALKIRTEKALPEDWAMTQNSLANAYHNRIRGDRPENIEQAIEHYRQALKVYTEKGFPEDWAATESNLARAYIIRIRGDRAENIELAIEHFSQALKVYTEKGFSKDWAGTENNLALAYRIRIRGDRAENIEQAIEHCRLALKVYTEKGFPKDWAATENNLANAYIIRIRGDRAENIEQAIEHFSQALKIRTEKALPEDWAGTENSLANAYSIRIRGDRPENIEQAIEHYRQALKVYTKKGFPEYWAGTENNLALAYSIRIRDDRAENIEQAIEHYRQALKIRTEKGFPEDWAATESNLAVAYTDRIRGDRAENIELAIEHFSQALKIFTPEQFPFRCRGTAYRLGNLCLEGRRFSEAGEAYSQGMEAAEELYRAALSQSSREIELTEAGDLYRRAGYALAMSGERVREAVAATERGRARGIGDALARDRADLERVREKNPEAYKLYGQAVQTMQSLESQERKGASGKKKALPSRDLMMQARDELYEAVRLIRLIPGYESFLKETGWEEIEDAVIEGQPLVYIAAAPGGGVALIVHRASGSKDASVETVPLDGFSEERLQEHIKIWFEAYGSWQEALQKLIEGKIEAEEYLQAKGRWFDAIESVTGQLWQEVAEPVYSALQPLKSDQAFLIPTGLLGLLPLHAAWREEGGKREYLQDLLPISYIPSARALDHARRTAITASAEKLLAIDEPRLLRPSPLPNSHAEVSTISSLFKNFRSEILEHEKATHSAVLKALLAVDVAHFSCHGKADWDNPENSGLLMANDEVLTIKDLFELHLSGARLATLSACETGVPGIEHPDEVVSLPSAFIRAGFAGAIGSLWTVREDSTAQLMTSFYQLWREKKREKKMQPVKALAEAQKELRKQERFGHPFYWAAFYMTGV